MKRMITGSLLVFFGFTLVVISVGLLLVLKEEYESTVTMKLDLLHPPSTPSQ